MSTDAHLETLRFFLRMPLKADPVLDEFRRRPNAKSYDFGGQKRFVYIPAVRPDAVLLVAHADVVPEHENVAETELEEDDFNICNRNHATILGADDRAGCALVSILGETLGHGMLITDGEECGCIGAGALAKHCPDLLDEIQERYRFLVEFDRRETGQYKCYDVGTVEFREYIKDRLGFREPDRNAGTDICHLARDICGVNLSVGYHGEHLPEEFLSKSEWLRTLDSAMEWLAEENLPRFPLRRE